MKKSFVVNYNFFLGLFWTLLFITLLAQFYLTSGIYNSLTFTLYFLLACFVVIMYTSRVLLPKAIRAGDMKPFIVKSIAASMVLAVILSYLISKFFPDEPKINITPFIYNLTSTIPTSLMLMVGFCGLEFFRQHLIQEKIHSEEKLKFLQNQMNPHIVFNVLNHIHILMQRNVDTASQLLIQFSGILRYQLYECNNTEVFLDKEITYLQEIVAIERIRWGELINVDFKVEVEDFTRKISPFILITFIENAFKHVSRTPDKKGFVNISIRESEGKLFLRAENSKSIKQPKRNNHNSGLGLENTKKRLSLAYPSLHTISIHESEDVFTIELSITLGR